MILRRWREGERGIAGDMGIGHGESGIRRRQGVKLSQLAIPVFLFEFPLFSSTHSSCMQYTSSQKSSLLS
jgi:hypothetical protein